MVRYFMRNTIGNYPFEVSKESGKVKIRFFPKSPNAKNPDGIVFVLSLDRDDREKLIKIIS